MGRGLPFQRGRHGLTVGGFAHNAAMNASQVERFFATLKAANPAPQTELEFSSVFELLTAVLLSAQATDVGVNKATKRLFAVANTPAQILALGTEGLESHIKTIGLYRSKAKHLLQTCQMLIDLHGGEVPRSREALEALPGVGRKTANVVLGNAFDVPGLTVDTHFQRLVRRFGWTEETDPVKIEHVVGELLPKREWTIFSHRVIWHGRRICHARRPACGVCPLAALCPSYGTGPTAPAEAEKLVRSGPFS